MARTYEEVVALLGELVESQQETDRKFQETDRLIREGSQETERRFQETDRLIREGSQETDRLIREGSQETERRFQETERRFQETERLLRKESQDTDRKLKEMARVVGNLGGQWGLFVENQVAPACERVFSARGIPVRMVSQRVKKRMEGDTLEIDVLVVDDGHVVVIEVKSSLSVQDVREFLDDLGQFRRFFPEYASWQVHGAVAGMRIEEGADRYAYRQGLFVLAQTGDTIKILNDEAFEPKVW